jgi:two-component system, chemotaxis family, chemotaxis protein CheY
MPKKVVLVGHCGPDSSYLRMAVQKALSDVVVTLADDDRDLQRLVSAGVDLLLVNRTLDYGFSAEGGAELIRHLRAGDPSIKAMLVSNYPEAQAEAVAAGALPGFGKREIGSPKVSQVIRDAVESEIRNPKNEIRNK